MSGNATLVAVASRSEDKAKQFISECSSYAPYAHLPEAVGSYEALLARQDIEVRGNWKFSALLWISIGIWRANSVRYDQWVFQGDDQLSYRTA